MSFEAARRRPDRAALHLEASPLHARILIVDDDERNAFAAMEALRDLGHELVVARSGEEALKKLLAEDYAVILLDLHMPGMDGYETAALIQARRRNSRIPIVFLTAVFRDEAHIFQAYSAGAVDVVFKPVDPFILRSKVQILVDLHLKTLEAQRETENRQRLLDENVRVREEKLRAEQALRRAQERQDLILSSLPIAFHSRSAQAPYDLLFASDSIEAITGFAARRFMDEPGFAASRLHPDDVAAAIEAVERARDTGRPYAVEIRWQCADGQYRAFLDQGVHQPGPDGAGEVVGVLLDVTDRRSLEEQLAHARKMEAVGQLTGGVAHDFNNLLMVILANADSLAAKAERDPRRKRQLAAIAHAADRGRSLTQQLLAFSRRQHLNPTPVDVKALITAFAPLLGQAVGESAHIELAFGEAPVCARVDPGQLETALLNLAVNARDAMPEGGTITLGAASVGARDRLSGEWVCIEVKDTGSGIAPDLRERIFEPFFTTKDVGKGSGLGLSQVYGFVRQSGGEVELESAPGAGATFRIFLPATEEPAAQRQAPEAEGPGGTEQILVVEDDEAVLESLGETLVSLGYQVVPAIDAAHAVEHLQSDAPVDLLFSDVVMPGGMNGVHLARAARQIRPDIKVLLTSGYLGANAAMADNEFPLIDKPYARGLLAAKLREVLGPPVRTKKSRMAARA